MATEVNAAKRGFGAKFFHWYESYQGKTVVNIIYSAGASVVIIGALFKILHWPGASQVLMIGMFTEAFLFLIGTLEHPHPEFHWENVFPQLLEYGTKPELLEKKAKQPRPTLLGAGVAGDATSVAAGFSVANAPAAEPSAKVPTIKEEEIKALKEGIANLAKTAAQLSELDKMAQASLKLGEKIAAAEEATAAYSTKITDAADTYVSKLAAAGSATDKFTQLTNDLSGTYGQVTEEMKSVTEKTASYKAGVEQVNKQIASLTSVYELQLQAVNTQIEAVKGQVEAVNAQSAEIKTQLELQKNATKATKEAAAAQEEFVAETKQLKKQVADLNAIYGSMLNALA